VAEIHVGADAVFMSILGISFKKSATFIRFGLVGLSGVFVNLICFTLFLWFGVNQYIASPAAIECSIVSNFIFNNYWTFRKRTTKDRTRIRALKFNLVSFLAFIVSYGTFIIVSNLFPDVAPHVYQIAGIIPAMAVNYYLNNYWTFRNHCDKDQQSSKASKFFTYIGKLNKVIPAMAWSILFINLIVLTHLSATV
jgi:putative flippase GtrA